MSIESNMLKACTLCIYLYVYVYILVSYCNQKDMSATIWENKSNPKIKMHIIVSLTIVE